MATLKIATLGSATLDTFLIGEALAAKRDVKGHDFVEQFPLGSKLDLDDVIFCTGGGASNAAATFARQGHATWLISKIGDDLPGREVLQDLHNEGIKTSHVMVDLDGATGYSTILLAPNGERTILTYRGASAAMKPGEFSFKGLEADWLYATSTGHETALFAEAVEWARQNDVKVAVDLDRSIGAPEHKKLMLRLLPHITLVKGNKEEMAAFFNSREVEGMLRTAGKVCQYAVVTDGHRGAWAVDGQRAYHMGLYKEVKVVDRTGAGDAFGSGLVAKLASGNSMDEALVFAAANATAVVGQVGAKAGILHKSAKVPLVKVASQTL